VDGCPRRLRGEIQKVSPDIEVGIEHNCLHTTFGIRPSVAGLSLARDAQAMDMLRVNPYHFLHAHHISYRPHRRILAEATRSLAGACAGRGVHLFPQSFMPPMTSPPLGRQDGLLAGIVPFALGADTFTCFSYELMKVIPGFAGGLADAHRIEGHIAAAEPYAFATVLRPLQSEVRGHGGRDGPKESLAEVANLMNRTGLPYRWLWDQRLEDAADRLAGPLIVPDAHCLTARQLAVIRDWADAGHGVLWIGNVPAEPWSSCGACPLPAEVQTGTFELALSDSSPIGGEVPGPVMLRSRVDRAGLQGPAAGTSDGRPALVLREQGRRREAWIAGLPLAAYVPPDLHSANRLPTGGLNLFRQLLRWLAPSPPLVHLDPFPPPNDYGLLRPWDMRDVPTMELLPLASHDGVLAIIFPYLRSALRPPSPSRRPRQRVSQRRRICGAARI
jgi:hypothetical protein